MQRGNLEVRAGLAAGYRQPDPRIFDLHRRLPDARPEASGRGLRRRHRQGVQCPGRQGRSASTSSRSQYLGTRHVILRQAREVKTPADMAGLKLRMPGSETWQFLGKALGANPTPLAFEEVYLAMQTGTVDGLENPLPDAEAAKFYEVSKQVVLTGHMVANIFFAVAKRLLGRRSSRRAEGGDRGRRGQGEGLQRRGRDRRPRRRQGLLRGQGRQGDDARRRGLPRPCPKEVPRSSKFAEQLAEGHAGADQQGGHCRRLGRAASTRSDLLLAPSEARRRAASGGVVRGHVRRFRRPGGLALCLRRPVSWTLEVCSITYVWIVFFAGGTIVTHSPAHHLRHALSALTAALAARLLAIFTTASLLALFLICLPEVPRLHPLRRPQAHPDPEYQARSASIPVSPSS